MEIDYFGLTEDEIKILKEPFKRDISTVLETIRKVYPYASAVITKSLHFINIKSEENMVEVNFEDYLKEMYGDFNTYSSEFDVIKHLEKHFKYPLLPTEEERILLQIEHGVRYPLKMDAATLKVVNAPKDTK